MKCHRNVTAPHHASSLQSLDIIVTLSCSRTKTRKTATRIFVSHFLASSTFTHAFILCGHVESHVPYPLIILHAP